MYIDARIAPPEIQRAYKISGYLIYTVDVLQCCNVLDTLVDYWTSSDWKVVEIVYKMKLSSSHHTEWQTREHCLQADDRIMLFPLMKY